MVLVFACPLCLKVIHTTAGVVLVFFTLLGSSAGQWPKIWLLRDSVKLSSSLHVGKGLYVIVYLSICKSSAKIGGGKESW